MPRKVLSSTPSLRPQHNHCSKPKALWWLWLATLGTSLGPSISIMASSLEGWQRSWKSSQE
eukprot:121476-Prorocentrum_lima.AAC.1